MPGNREPERAQSEERRKRVLAIRFQIHTDWEIFMTCLLALTLSCLFSPERLYVTGEIQSQFTKPTYEGRWCNGRWCSGPMGVFRVGMNARLTETITLDYGVSHTSYLSTSKDRGEESFYMSLTFRPFARR